MLIVFILLISFLSTCLITYLIRQYALNKNLLDIPNERSSHETPTPRGGGLSVVIVFLITLLGLQQFNIILLADNALIGIVISSVLISSIGFWDDLQSIPARWRFGVHIIASLILLICLPQLPTLNFFGVALNLSIFGYIFYTLVLAWLLNLYNFMDGIDGFASSEAINVSLSAALLLLIQGDTQWSLVLILLSICVAGFLIWNWPHAKIFMGDACSGFLGFILGGLALMTTLEGLINLWSWFILLAVFIADSSLTLGSRILKGKKWYQAHCTHAYQCYALQLIKKFEQTGLEKSVARTYAHQQINFNLILMNIFWLLPWAMIASFYSSWSFIAMIFAYTPLIFIVKQLRKYHV
jgi:Fuc2NAc and GlcNAc transferase